MSTKLPDTPLSTTPAIQRRWVVVVIGVFGAALVVMPVAFGMFSKAPQGAVMIAQFNPFMTTARLDGYQHELEEINTGVQQTDSGVVSALFDDRGGRTAFNAAFPGLPGLTRPVSGTYNASTHDYVLAWTSQVSGGPFNGFTGYWHLAGKFVQAKGSK